MIFGGLGDNRRICNVEGLSECLVRGRPGFVRPPWSWTDVSPAVVAYELVELESDVSSVVPPRNLQAQRILMLCLFSRSDLDVKEF